MKIIVSEEVSEFIESFTKVNALYDEYYYIPFWFMKRIGEQNEYSILPLDSLPTNLIKHINDERRKDSSIGEGI